MQQQTARVVPAGWYQDPADDSKVRWWNGLTWTEHVELKPAGQGTGAAGAAADSDPMTRRTSMMLDARGPSTGTIPIQGVAAPVRQIRTTTTAAWLLATTPVITTILGVIAAYVFFYVSPTPVVVAAAVVVMVLGFLWAVGDARALENRGLGFPSPLLAAALPILGPLLYLLVRRGKVTGGAPLLVFLALLMVAVVVPVGLGVAGAVPTVTKALEVQRAVHDDLVGSGAATAVTCPPILESTATGTVFTCDATLPSGDVGHVWVSFDNDQGQFSWALANR